MDSSKFGFLKKVAEKYDLSDDFVLIDPFGKTYLRKKLTNEVIDEIKNFNHEKLTPKEESLVIRLMDEWDLAK
ncbi:MAG: hypothetical protein C5B43_00945 [Verrucomicrobia bacterium]|nr:MAG: hypothetical protein C5B43_00945 [Verrucomicrobiota bacterium]